MNTKLVVFDMAGTTVNDGKTVYKSVQYALAAGGYDFELKDIMKKVGGLNKLVAIEQLIAEKNAEYSLNEVNLIHDQFLATVNKAYKTDEDLKEIDGTTELFKFLKNKGIKIALDTGYHRKTANILIERMGWQKERLIDISITSDEVAEGRPAPLMIKKAMKELGIEDSQTIIKVGDTTSDIKEGRSANCGLVVAIYSGTQSEEELLVEKPDHLIHKITELTAFV